jgi:hypothetical protein
MTKFQQPLQPINSRIRIEYSDTGIASRIGDTIVINKKLQQFDQVLYSSILLHEYEHTSGFTFKDFLMDLKVEHIKDYRGRYYWFILTHPSSWTEFLPIIKFHGHWVINPSLLMFQGLMLLAIGGVWYLYG